MVRVFGAPFLRAHASNSGSLALDSQDRPHISYYQFRQGTAARYATHDGTQWNVQTLERVSDNAVDEQHHMGQFTAIDLDSQGRPHMVYLYSYILSYGTWQFELHYARKCSQSFFPPRQLHTYCSQSKPNSRSYRSDY